MQRLLLFGGVELVHVIGNPANGNDEALAHQDERCEEGDCQHRHDGHGGDDELLPDRLVVHGLVDIDADERNNLTFVVLVRHDPFDVISELVFIDERLVALRPRQRCLLLHVKRVIVCRPKPSCGFHRFVVFVIR